MYNAMGIDKCNKSDLFRVNNVLDQVNRGK